MTAIRYLSDKELADMVAANQMAREVAANNEATIMCLVHRLLDITQIAGELSEMKLSPDTRKRVEKIQAIAGCAPRKQTKPPTQRGGRNWKVSK